MKYTRDIMKVFIMKESKKMIKKIMFKDKSIQFKFVNKVMISYNIIR